MIEATAMAAPYNLVVRPTDCQLRQFWVVLLDNGLQVFEDRKPNMRNAWLRLKEYCGDYNVNIASMAYVDVDHLNNQINMPHGCSGYVVMNRMGRLVAPGTHVTHAERGFGYLENGRLLIYWLDEQAGVVSFESRDLENNTKGGNSFLIHRNV